MKIVALCIVGAFALARDCGDNNNGGGGGGAAGQVWEQVFGTWSCTAAARPSMTFQVQRLSDTGVVHRWLSDGAQGDASVHTDALYLENFKGIAYDDYGYTEEPKGTLAALDEYTQPTGAAPYHCVKQ